MLCNYVYCVKFEKNSNSITMTFKNNRPIRNTAQNSLEITEVWNW